MSDNWVVSTLEDALSNWNDKLAEIWSLVSQTPESFRGGEIWTVIVGIHNALVGFGYGLLRPHRKSTFQKSDKIQERSCCD